MLLRAGSIAEARYQRVVRKSCEQFSGILLVPVLDGLSYIASS
jgi:hypothetical protein